MEVVPDSVIEKKTYSLQSHVLPKRCPNQTITFATRCPGKASTAAPQSYICATLAKAVRPVQNWRQLFPYTSNIDIDVNALYKHSNGKNLI